LKNRVLIVVGFVAALIAVRALIVLPGWLRERRENRQFIAVNNLTPDRLVARCGQPAADQTKNLFPIVARDISYKASDATVVFKFSKTAEASGDWVFMAMQDGNGNAKYESPEAKISALPCLDSRK
jgi:hypothetical protein